MERIGYIYRYNEDEKKGILVCRDNSNTQHVFFSQLIFNKSDCVSDVQTGQLVYYKTDAKDSATHIEKVSLNNFKRDLVSAIASCYDTCDWHDCFDLTHLKYKDIENSCVLSDEDLLDFDDIFPDVHSERNTENEKLPDGIDELYSLLRSSQHGSFYPESNICIDVLKIDYWIDDVFVRSPTCYGKTAEEVLDLFDLFVKKRKKAYYAYQNRYRKSSKDVDDSISPSWKLVLESLSEDELRTICKKEPLLQPALPSEFCLDNLDVLSINYGFPDVSVCEAYYRYRISIVKLSAEYNFMSEKLYVAANCTAKHKENEGVPACKMGKNVLLELKDLLEKQYHTIVLKDVKQRLSLLSNNMIDGEQRVSFLLKEGNSSYLARLGSFVDTCEYNCVLSKNDDGETIRYDCDYSTTIFIALFAYKGLTDEDKACLDSAIRNKFKECVMGIAKERHNDRKVYQLCSLINDYPQYLTSEDFETIKEIVHSEFVELDNFEELDNAANCGLITVEHHLDRYKEITKDYDIGMLLGILNDHFDHKNMPTLTQTYLIKQVFDKYNFMTLNSHHYIKVGYDTIRNIGDLIDWFNHECKYGYLNAQIFDNILKEQMERLDRGDRWGLFDKGLISSPGMDNIRDYLDNAYNQNRFENKNEYFRKECFQDVMCTDVLMADNNKLKFMIAEHLDTKHQKELQNKCEGVLKLFLWVINPDEKFDWNLIISYLSELPEEKQIRLFRCIFYLIAKKSIEISIDELYKFFVESEKKVCHAVSGMVYLLKEQLSPTGIITSEKLDEIIGKEINDLREFLLAKTFFYPCGGHLALTQMKQDRDYHTYNGFVDKINVQEKECYSIHFYDIPHDVCDIEVDWLDNKYIQVAKVVLDSNIKTKIIEDTYVVDDSEEIALKQFVMAYDIDDRCCLLDPKQALIEKGYLPPNNSYQPLYTNYIRPYDDDSFDVCRCTNYIDVDPIDGIPFYWCNKKPCVRRCHYILPLSEWEKYKLSDFIYILLGCESVNLSKVWKMTSEISLFFNAYIEFKRSSNGEPIKQSEAERLNNLGLSKKADEIGVLTEEFSVVQDIYDDDEEYDDYGGNYTDSYYYENDEPTFERYNGSYAQDEMGYSDDDIDTIFDGDPSAYWNID